MAARESLRSESDELEAAYSETDELPEEIDARLSEIETALEAFEQRPVIYAPEDVTRAGAFVSVDGSGRLRIERGYVRPEDEAPIENAEVAATDEGVDADPSPMSSAAKTAAPIDAAVQSAPAEEEEDEGLRPLPDRLLTELTAYRTLSLREALGRNSNVAFQAALHVLCLKLFYRYGCNSCLDIEPKTAAFGSLAPGLGDTELAASVDARHREWSERLPGEPGDLDALAALDAEQQQALFAHCISLTVNAVNEAYNRRPRAIAHADQLAEALSLDIAKTGWAPNVDNFLGRVTKARILDAVREARGEDQAPRIEMLKKGDMAAQAEHLLAGSGWLPEPLRTPRRARHGSQTVTTSAQDEAPVEETEAIESETAIDEIDPKGEAEDASADEAQEVAAE